VDAPTLCAPRVRIRGRNFMALVVAPEFPFGEWFAALDRQLIASPGFFADRPVVADLTGLAEAVGPEAVPVALDGLAARGLRLVGVEGVRPVQLAGSPWEALATALHGRDTALEPGAASDTADPVPPEASGAASLLIERPVRSGQSGVFEEGDIIVVGAVASGAEVIAGGSVHVYGALRGRAIAGLRAGSDARIFCRKLEAEMVGVDQLYRTAENWGPDLHGRAVQVRCDRGALRLTAFE
jgi:septum site-determining protein MinC